MMAFSPEQACKGKLAMLTSTAVIGITPAMSSVSGIWGGKV
jgi:hypothetical protein